MLEVVLDHRTLTDALLAQQTKTGILIPAGALSRLLDLDVRVWPSEGRITGTAGHARSAIFLDIDAAEVRAGGQRFTLTPDEAAASATDIYISLRLLERLLPVRATVDISTLTLTLQARERLPIQERLERLARLRTLGPAREGQDAVLSVSSPAGLLSLPTFDIALEVGSDTRGNRWQRRYDMRAGSDFLGAGLQAYVASDARGRAALARLSLERRDPEGGLLGPLHATGVAAGDVFTPNLALGPRSVAVRGITLSTRPLGYTSVFERVDLRGELPLGHDVEIYVNDVLRGGQSSPVEGRYEFTDVPLMRGVNVVRLVDYGPHGQRTETVRVITVGGGQLPRGKTVMDFGIGQQDAPVIDLAGQDRTVRGPGAGEQRAILNVAHGFSERLTGTFGLATYAPVARQPRGLATVGVRGSIAGLAAQIDAARDGDGGAAVAVALAGQPFGVAMTARDSEYARGFLDETTPRAGDGRALERSSEVTLDFTVQPGEFPALPISARAARDLFADGGAELYGMLRTSAPISGVLASIGLDFESTKGAVASERMTGNLSLATYAAYAWQIRSSFDYDIEPHARPLAASVTVDRNLGENLALRSGLGQSFVGLKESTLQAGLNVRLPGGDLAVTADYSRPRGDWRAGLQFAFSLVRHPLTGRYVMRHPGAAAGGNLAVQAFVDANGNGRRDENETPAAGVRLTGGVREERTDDEGRALVTGLGFGPRARVAVDIDDVDLPYIEAPSQAIEFTPRRGGVAVVAWPLKPVSEALVRVRTRQPDGKLVGLSAVRVRLVAEDGTDHEALTEYDGSVVFTGLRPGTYAVELDRAQAERLDMALPSPVRLTIPPGGGVFGDVDAVVAFGRGAPLPRLSHEGPPR